MQAVQINNYGDNSLLVNVDIPIPQPKPNQVLVKLKASAVNPVDYKIRSGFMAAFLKKEFPFTLGWEGAGIITEMGSKVTTYKVGDEVMVMPNFMQGGTYAEYVVVNEDEVIPKPTTIGFDKASFIPFSIGTAYTSLIHDAKISKGQKLLIHGAGGAVGQMAVQIAKIKELEVFGTAKGTHIKELADLGIDRVIDYSKNDFSQELAGLDVILDLVGGETLAKSYPLLKKGGTIVSTTQPPSEAELKKYGISGKMTLARSNESMFTIINQWIDSGLIQINNPQIFSLSDAKEALALVEGRKSTSKVIFEL